LNQQAQELKVTDGLENSHVDDEEIDVTLQP
jgi:hypothetical protein